MSGIDGRSGFDLLMELPTEQIRLDCATLHLARDVYPFIDVGAYLGRLDELADEAAALRPGLAAPLRYQAMREVLVERHALQGNSADYYDPQNSYLNRVLDRGLGIPISLAAVWMEVGRRLKWPVFGVGFPGHFLVRIDDRERFILVDAFNAGRSLSQDDCRQMLEQQFEGKVALSASFFEPIDTRAVLARMLNNLRSIYALQHDWQRLRTVLRRLAAVEPENGKHLHELAALHYSMGDLRGAYAHLSAYVSRLSPGQEQDQARDHLRTLERALAEVN